MLPSVGPFVDGATESRPSQEDKPAEVSKLHEQLSAHAFVYPPHLEKDTAHHYQSRGVKRNGDGEPDGLTVKTAKTHPGGIASANHRGGPV